MATAEPGACDAIRHDASNTWVDIYTGTADALIAAGLIRTEELPGEPGVNKVQRTFLPDGSELRKGQNYRNIPGVRQIVKRGCRVAIEIVLDDAERERREAKREAKMKVEREQREQQHRLEDKARRAREAGMTLEQWALRGVPMHEDEFRDRVLGEVDLFEQLTGSILERGYGYTLQAPTLARLRMLFEAMRTLIREAPVAFDPATHDREVKSRLESEGVSLRPPRPALRLIR